MMDRIRTAWRNGSVHHAHWQVNPRSRGRFHYNVIRSSFLVELSLNLTGFSPELVTVSISDILRVEHM